MCLSLSQIYCRAQFGNNAGKKSRDIRINLMVKEICNSLYFFLLMNSYKVIKSRAIIIVKMTKISCK